MALQKMRVKFNGISPLLQNNAQTVDIFNKYSKLKKPLVDKKKLTDEDVLELRKIDVESKIHWDDDLGVYAPASWFLASLAKNSWDKIRVKKDHVRAGIFVDDMKFKLYYDGDNLVKTIKDVVNNDKLTTTLILPQRGIRLAKSSPIFHKWSFEVGFEYDDSIFNEADLKVLIEYCGMYNGFGDFRPSYGRCKVEFKND